jgi:RsiW-degrading membrane proteinase PrsW (M82 family)
MILYGTLGICAFGAAVLVYRHDLYEREKLPVLSFAAFLGMAAMWIAGRMEAWTFDAWNIRSSYGIAAIAAVEEEFLKLFVVLALLLLVRREFNDPMDGLVYGSLAGLGMAVEESLFYISHLPVGEVFLPPAELVRVSGHLVMGGISGFALGPAVLGSKRRIPILIACFVAAAALHFSWDWIILLSPEEVTLSPVQTLCGAVLMLLGLLLYGALITIASRKSHALFASAMPERLWGWPFAELRSGKLRRS